MECLIQYLDDLDDLYYAVALVMEKIRLAVRMTVTVALAAIIPVCGVMLALAAPLLGLAAIFMSLSVLLYCATVRGQAGPLVS